MHFCTAVWLLGGGWRFSMVWLQPFDTCCASGRLCYVAEDSCCGQKAVCGATFGMFSAVSFSAGSHLVSVHTSVAHTGVHTSYPWAYLAQRSCCLLFCVAQLKLASLLRCLSPHLPVCPCLASDTAAVNESVVSAQHPLHLKLRASSTLNKP